MEKTIVFLRPEQITAFGFDQGLAYWQETFQKLLNNIKFKNVTNGFPKIDKLDIAGPVLWSRRGFFD